MTERLVDPASDAGRAALGRLVGGTVSQVVALSGGASSGTWAFTADGEGHSRRFIFQRSEGIAARGLPRRVQAEVQRRAGALGVPVAPVVAVPAPSDGLGDSVVTGFVSGEALAPKWLKGDLFATARAALPAQCATSLARLHAAPLTHWADLELGGGSGATLLAEMFDWYRRLGVDVPAFDLAFAWLKPRMPAAPATCLAHGDFRSGNFLVDEAGLAAVLDWELTHRSVPAEDLGWLCVQAWRFGQWRLPVGGFGTREALLAAYREAGGVVAEDDLHLWEVYGNLRWGMSCLQLADDHVSGRVRSVERAAIGRRVSEVAADLVHLIAYGEV
jgi:aminoglycoside phosphotransferase (APT) family kinase protein